MRLILDHCWGRGHVLSPIQDSKIRGNHQLFRPWGRWGPATAEEDGGRKTRVFLVGGWATPLKNISQLRWLFPIYGKIQKMATKPPTSLSMFSSERHATERNNWSWRINRNQPLYSSLWKPHSFQIAGTLQTSIKGVQAHLVHMKLIPMRKSSHQYVFIEISNNLNGFM